MKFYVSALVGVIIKMHKNLLVYTYLYILILESLPCKSNINPTTQCFMQKDSYMIDTVVLLHSRTPVQVCTEWRAKK